MYKKAKHAIYKLGRTSHHVSVKIMLLNKDGTKVLMTQMQGGRYGLPGGHIDRREDPILALRRELFEELGLTTDLYSDVSEEGFFRAGSRLVLMYTGVLSEDIELMPDGKEVIDGLWVTYDDIDSGKVHTRTYEDRIKRLLLDRSEGVAAI